MSSKQNSFPIIAAAGLYVPRVSPECWPPVCLEGSLRSASGSDPGSFQVTASALGLSMRFCVYHFKSRASLSYSSLSSPIPAGFESDILGTQVPGEGNQVREPNVGFGSLNHWGEFLQF